MDPDAIQKVITDLAAEEQSLIDAIKAVEARLTKVRAARAHLMALDQEEPLTIDVRLSDACRMVLRSNAGRSMSPTEVRDGLRAIGYDTSSEKHSNIMASIHSVLKRLAESGTVKSKE